MSKKTHHTPSPLGELTAEEILALHVSPKPNWDELRSRGLADDYDSAMEKLLEVERYHKQP